MNFLTRRTPFLLIIQYILLAIGCFQISGNWARCAMFPNVRQSDPLCKVSKYQAIGHAVQCFQAESLVQIIVCAAMSSKECKKIAMLPQFAKRARNELEEVGGGG